jgi:hypothetical protein
MSGLRSQAPVEPVLDMDEIQGMAVPGFFKPHQTLIYVHLPRQRDGMDQFRGFLRDFVPSVATAAKTLKDRRDHRQTAVTPRATTLRRGAPARHRPRRDVLIAVGFSAQGLVKLTPGASEIPSVAFQGGLVSRRAIRRVPEPRGIPPIGSLVNLAKSSIS